MSVAEKSVNESSAQGSSFYSWYVVIVLMLAQTNSFIDRMIMGLLVGPIRQSFEISDTQYSLLAGLAFAIFYAIMGLPLARIADRFNRTRLIAIAIAFWSVMTALCGMARGFWSLFAARVGVGVGEAALSPAAYSIITDYFSKGTLARALSIYTIGVTIGSGLAYIVGGWVVAITMQMGTVVLPVLGEKEGWQLTFFIVGIPGLLIALLILTIREPERRGRMQTGETEDGRSENYVSIGEVVSFIGQRARALGTHIIGMSIFIMVVFSLNIWGPEYLIRTFEFERADAGKTFGVVIMVTGTAGLLLGGTLADRWFAGGKIDAYSRVILFSMIGMLPFVIALAFVQTAWLGIACIGIAIFFSAFQGGIGGGVIQLIAPNQMRGQVVAVYFLVANLVGMGFGPTIIALATDYVFRDDGALNQSIALCGAILIPVAAITMLSGLKQVRASIEEARQWEAAN